MTKNTIISAVILLFLSLSIYGCSSRATHNHSQRYPADPVLVGYDIANFLTTRAYPPIPNGAQIATATFVHLDNLQQSSTLGRAISGHIVSALNDLGYSVMALNLANTIRMNEEIGELALTRQNKDLMFRQTEANAIIAGTYHVARHHIYITSRLIDPGTGRILSSREIRIPLNDEMRSMLPITQSITSRFGNI